METIKFIEWVDIQAPRDEVFEILANCDRRLQLSPTYGEIKVEGISDDFPGEGSRYQVMYVEGDEPGYEVIVTTYQPSRRFSYEHTDRQQRRVSWSVQDTAAGTRLSFEGELDVDESDDESVIESERNMVRRWLNNIRRYAELRDGQGKRLARSVLDRTALKWTASQRRVILLLLAFETLMCLTALVAILGFGLVSLFSP